MKKIILLSLISISFSQYFGGNISLMGQFPQGEFKEQEVPWGVGLDVNAMYHINDYLAFGINGGGSQYGFAERDVPFNQWVAVGLIEETKNNIGYGNILMKIIPFKGPVRPYFEGLLGIKNLSTQTKLFSQSSNCNDPDTDVNECEIASTTNASDSALGYGVGGGLEIGLTTMKDEEGNEYGSLSFFIAAKYLWGGEVQYLKEGGITVIPDPDGIDFPTISC